MLTIRRVEETLLELYSEGLLTGTVHTCIGQEACSVGVVSALDRDRDVLWSNHRGHGHFIAYCDQVEGLVAEIMGRATGVCGGFGGSQHLHHDSFYSNGIVGGGTPCAVGSALAERSKGSGAVTAVFVGDGALGEGIVYESLNMAALWSAPVLFVVEDNGYAQTTPKHLEQAGEVARRADPFGIRCACIQARDVADVHATALEAVGWVRERSRPFFLVLETYRLAPHSKGDDTRDPAEVAHQRTIDPLVVMRAELETVSSDRLSDIDRAVEQRVSAAVVAARRAPSPSLSIAIR
jgi:TPP-dependent pyruvate/acetoin dehydrogenase alpha subunit